MRTKYSFYNFLVSTITAVVLPIIGLIKVRLFIHFYGSDINGLQVTIAQVITFLNICELAYSLAFRQLLYKPLAENDQEGVLKIYHGACKVFRATGWIVLAAGAALALIFPSFATSPLDYWQTVGTFMLLAFPYGISYFLMGPNFVIMADQKEYKINIWIQTIAIIRMMLMVLVIKLKMPFIFILFIEGANIIVANTVARKIALKAYPWLKQTPVDQKDKSFKEKAGFAMVQRLSDLAITQTDNIVITAFMGYGMSSVYGSYSYLTDSISKITQTMVMSPMNSFGNLFNDDNADAYSVFCEFFNFSCWISTIVAICIFIVMPQFVEVWLSMEEYKVPVVMALLFSINIYYMTMRQPIIICRDANGLYVNARNNAYLMAAVKIILSIILVQYLGLLGVILATLLTYWTIDFFYNPILVYRNVFHLPSWRYYAMVFTRVALAFVVGYGCYLGWLHFVPTINGVGSLIVSMLLLGISVAIIVTILYAILYRSFRHLFVRLKAILDRKHQQKQA